MKEWQPLVAGLGVALVLMGLFVASYAEALSAPKPHEVPFGVGGSANAQLVNRIERQAGTAWLLIALVGLYLVSRRRRQAPEAGRP